MKPIPMFPANTTGLDNINVDLIVTAPVQSVPMRAKNAEKDRVDGKVSTMEDPAVTFKMSDFPKLEGFA